MSIGLSGSMFKLISLGYNVITDIRMVFVVYYDWVVLMKIFICYFWTWLLTLVKNIYK